jgi:hypothetical protein
MFDAILAKQHSVKKKNSFALFSVLAILLDGFPAISELGARFA